MSVFSMLDEGSEPPKWFKDAAKTTAQSTTTPAPLTTNQRAY